MKSFQRVPHLALILLGLVVVTSSASAQSGTTTQSTTTFHSGGAKITLSRYEPCGEGKHPAIVLVHGLQSVESSKSALDTICRAYAARGYAVFLIHYFERTKTSEKEIAPLLAKFKNFLADDNKPRDEATCKIYSTWLDTLRDGLTHIRVQPNVDRERVALVGLSLGGFMSMTLATEENLQIAAVVSHFGGMPRDVGARVKKMPPMQVIHGDKDLVVPVSEAHSLEKLAKAKSFSLELHIFANAGHVFTGPSGEFQLLDAIRADLETARFLGEHLKQVRQAQR
jgi:dienelactone hydrolase